MASDLVASLNPQQREAVTAGTGPILVLAGPGSGKTRVLTHRLAYLVREMDVPPSRVMAVTFTNKAAGEMRARVETLLGGRLDGLVIGTFHSICARLLRREANYLPYRNDYAIYDTDDQQALMKTLLADEGVDPKKFSPGKVLHAISAAKNELVTPETYNATDYFGEVVRRMYERYQKALVNNNAMDFDDLLMQTVLLLRAEDALRERYQHRLEHILVDEFQDTNMAQYELVSILAQPQRNILVVGDEDQGIYAFRGADYRNVMQFQHDFPDARVILLEQNYRSTQIVLDAARAVIDRNPQRTRKALFTDRRGGDLVTVYEAYSEEEEGQFIATTIQGLVRHGDRDYRDIAVMYRTNAQSRALEDACVRARIPYRLIGGVGFYRRREIRDLIAYLRLVLNPDDTVSFARVVNVPGRGIGDASVDKFRAWAAERGEGQWEALQALSRGEKSPLTGRPAKAMAEFALMLAAWRELLPNNDLHALFTEVLTGTRYNLYLHEISDTESQLAERQENLREFEGLIKERRDLELSDFLADISLVADVNSLSDDQNMVTLMTLHAAKGLEFPVVFIAGIEEDLLPHVRARDNADEMAEERRLFYVGLTRAKDQLFLTYAFRRTFYGDNSPRRPSKFLLDIPGGLVEGASVRLTDMHDRDAYRRLTSWENDSFTSPRRERDEPAREPRESRPDIRARIIPFKGADIDTPPLKYRPGMRVREGKYGEGMVIESRYSAADQDEIVSISFGKAGIRKLFASYANIVILPE